MLNFSLAVIYIEHSPEKFPNAFQILQSYLEKIKFWRITYFKVNNKDTGDSYRKINDKTYYLQGDNSEREFSGWQKGIDFLETMNLNFNVILFVNEAFENPGTSFLIDYASFITVFKSYILNAAIGRIDSHGKETEVLGYFTKSWICSNCFFISGKLLKSLKTFVTINNENMNDFFEKEFIDSNSTFKETAPINKEYKEHIIQWLTIDWYGHFSIDPDHWNLFREKTKAILNEALLSARLRELNAPVLSYGQKKYY